MKYSVEGVSEGAINISIHVWNERLAQGKCGLRDYKVRWPKITAMYSTSGYR